VRLEGKSDKTTFGPPEEMVINRDGEDFIQIGEAFEQGHIVSKVQLGNATLRLMRQRELVDFAVQWIEQNRK